MICDLLTDCAFFNNKMEMLEEESQKIKKKYCFNDCSKCARRLIYKELGRSYTPLNLSPDMMFEAKVLINNVVVAANNIAKSFI